MCKFQEFYYNNQSLFEFIQMEAPSQLFSKKSKTPVNLIRELTNIKLLMQKRVEQRAMVIYQLANGKYQNSLIISRQLIFTSQKIWRDFDDSYKQQFEENYFFRTSKNKELTEFLLDCTLICKVYMKSKKKDDVIEVIQKIQIPDFEPANKQMIKTQQEIIEFNDTREIQCKICACLLTFIELIKNQKAHEHVIKLYKMYKQFVDKHYGRFEFATATFAFANYYYEIGHYQQAINQYNICLDIRKKNSLNQGYVDVLINSSICLRAMGKLKQAILRTRTAIEVYRDLKKPQNENLDDYYLFMAKMQQQNADFHDALENFLITYKLRQNLEANNPKKIQIQLNLLFFYKTVERCCNDALVDQTYFIKDRKEIEKKKKAAYQVFHELPNVVLNRQQFAKYDDFNSRMAHLTLVITEQFFDKLAAEQIPELQNLIHKLGSCSFYKGITELSKTSFFQDRKTRQLLLQANPQIKNYKKTL